jgi:hypothetical protein
LKLLEKLVGEIFRKLVGGNLFKGLIGSFLKKELMIF